MGSPLGPTFANIFMCSLEERMMDECPLNLYPLFYCRYVDDTFVLLRSEHDAELFCQHANSRHNNISFTLDKESNDRLSFLDVLVSRDNSSFNTTVFRKTTFTGLGMSFYSSCFFNFKLNSVSTLIHRALVLTSSWCLFHNEILTLQNFFTKNNFPLKLFLKRLNRVLNNFFTPKEALFNVPKLKFYASFPFTYDKTFHKKFSNIINEHFPAVNAVLIPRNPLTIGSLFRFKDRLPPLMTSGVVYMYTCPVCKSGTYVGSSARLLKVRIDSHRGISYRTGSRLSNPEHSNIRNHSRYCKTTIEYKDFHIIGQTSNLQDLLILESLNIKQLVPKLNCQTSSSPLYLS